MERGGHRVTFAVSGIARFTTVRVSRFFCSRGKTCMAATRCAVRRDVHPAGYIIHSTYSYYGYWQYYL